MYSIDKTIARVKDISTNEVTQYNIKPSNTFDLINLNVYDKQNNLIEQAQNPEDYDFAFGTLLKKTYPLYECEGLLNYHYEKTDDKILFLKHIEFFILLYPFLKAQPQKGSYIKNWIKDKQDLINPQGNTSQNEISNGVEQARKLIKKKKEAKQYVKALETDLLKREKEEKRQLERAEKGLMNEYAFQKMLVDKAQLALRDANTVLSNIEEEIEIQQLASSLNQIDEVNKNESVKEKAHLSIAQIALIYCYERKPITRINSNQIAKEHGHNSGEKLFQRFTFYSSLQNRKGKPFPPTSKKFENKIALLESVIEKLSSQAKSKATDELNALKTLFKNIDQ